MKAVSCNNIIPKISSLMFLLISILLILSFLPPETMLLGKKIWYNPPKIIDWNFDAKSTSQQIFDVYSLTHITHGILFFLAFKLLGASNLNALYMSLGLEILYEFVSNTPKAIEIYRDKWPNYRGDSIININGDILCALLGVLLVYKLPFVGILFAIISEIILYKYSAGLLAHLQTNYTRTIDLLL
jgi:hypothetical protein